MKKLLQKTSMLCMLLLFAIMANAQNDVTATWNFQTMGAGTVNLEGKIGTVASDVSGIELTVDATNGKLKSRDNDAQFNAGTILKVPVKTTKDTVKVVSNPGYHNFKIGGVSASSDNEIHRATSAEASQGYVEIVGTGGSYLFKIQVVQVSMIQEKELYSTTFTGWTDADPSAKAESTVSWTTKYSNEALIFSIFDTQISSTNKNTGKFPTWTGGYLMASKSSDPYVITSALASITKVHFLHGATGSNRGWKLEAKGDGDADWVTISDAFANPASGMEVDAEINRTNCQLRFTNLASSQNAYLFQLIIYGNVDMSKTPSLKSFKVNGKSYAAADVFDQEDNGDMTANLEIASSETNISSDNPLTDIVAANGEIGTVTYEQLKDDTTIVTIPVTAKGMTVNYIATIVRKPSYTLTYYNTDGNVIGTQIVEKDATIATFKYTESDVTVADGYAFRGWFANASGSGNRKYTTADVITDNANIYALATEIEYGSTTARYTYNFADQYFYDEDHEAFNCVGAGKFHDSTHGWQFTSSDDIQLLVGGNAYIVLSECKYGGTGTLTLKDSKGNVIGTADYPASTDGASVSFCYKGGADILHLTFDCSPYIHNLTIVNVQANSVTKNDAGYYVVSTGNAASLLNTLMIANASANSTERTFIFIPDGTYDLGETALTAISGSNISIIGQSEDKTIIKNAPKVANEGIGTTATFLNTGRNTYFQDLSMKNALDYYASGSAGRGVVLQDKGSRTICKNVSLLSYQDTYYSNANSQFYFEDGEIHGVVDYVCGSGDVFYNRVKFVNESRTATPSSGDVTIAAPYTDASNTYGYVMSNCTIENLAKSFNFGRAWGGVPRLAWIHTTINQPGTIAASRFTTEGMNVYADKFVEYNSVDVNGNVVSPLTNIVKFYKDAKDTTYETILTDDEAGNYALNKVFTNWAPDELATQVAAPTASIANGKLSWNAVDGAIAYAVFKDGVFVTITSDTSYMLSDGGKSNYTVRSANAMGGFGASSSSISTGIGSVSNNGEAVNVEFYSIDGMKLANAKKGVNIAVKTYNNGKTSIEKVIVK